MSYFFAGVFAGIVITTAIWVYVIEDLIQMEMESCCAGKETHTDI